MFSHGVLAVATGWVCVKNIDEKLELRNVLILHELLAFNRQRQV